MSGEHWELCRIADVSIVCMYGPAKCPLDDDLCQFARLTVHMHKQTIYPVLVLFDLAKIDSNEQRHKSMNTQMTDRRLLSLVALLVTPSRCTAALG